MSHDKLLSELMVRSSKNMASQLYEKIRRLIISGNLPSGYTFPNEADMCQLLHVGRTTLREAYKALEANGYITRTKRGTFVNEAEKIAAAIPFSIALKESDYVDLIEYRAIIESQIAGLAAQRATEENFRNLEHFYERMKEQCGNIQKLTYYDTQFHMELANASRNSLLQRLMLITCDVFTSGMYQAFTIDTEQNIEEAIAAHFEILTAIRQGDSERAQDAMMQHLLTIKKRGPAHGI